MKKRISLVLPLLLLLSCVSLAPARAASTKTLEFVTGAVYNYANTFSDGLAYAENGSDYKYIDMQGNTVISNDTLKKILKDAGVPESMLGNPRESGIVFGAFHEGIAMLQYDVESIYIDKTGKLVTTREYSYEFSEGYARVSSPVAGEIVLINIKGEEVARKNYLADTDFEEGYSYARVVHNGLLPVWRYDADDELIGAGYLDTKLEISIPLKFEDVRPFNDGIAYVKQNGKWGLINTKGDFVVEPQFDDFWVADASYSYTSFSGGYAAVEKDGKWGYIDKTGKTAVPFTLNYYGDNEVNVMGFFNEGLAYVKQDGKCGYINTKGGAVTPLEYDDANYFTGGSALVGKDGKYWIIDKTGAKVSSQEWTFEFTSATIFDPDIIFYMQDGKWGLARITDAAAGTEQPSAWAVAEVTRATELGLVTDGFKSGYTLATTRAEFCALGVRLYETVTGEEITERAEFPDTNDVNVQKLAGLGIVNGMDGGVFNPATQLTREQAATIIARLLEKLGVDVEPSAPVFTDNDSFGEWSYDAIGLVQSLKIMNGRENGSFDPKAVYTRQECILTMLRTFDSVAG